MFCIPKILKNESNSQQADATTAKKYEDNSGTAFNIVANGPLWAFDGSIVELADVVIP